LWIAVGLAAAAMLAVAVVFLGTARTGRLVVNVADAKGAAINRADIYVDGRKQCDTPCKVEQLGAGSHEVKVVADGFETPAVQTVSVDPRQDATVNFTLSGGTSLSGLRVAGNQPGVKLYVDDREAGPLPQEVRDLAPGPHTIRVAGSDRYQPLEKQVAVEKDSVSDLGTVTLKVLRGKATITLTTLGARVYLVSGSDRRELPTLPISVDIDTTKTWSLEASKPGYDDLRQPISFDDGQAEKSFVVALDPHTAPPLQAYQAPQPQAVQVQAQAPSPQPTPAAQPPTPAQAPPTEAGEAFLNINSIPPSTCFVDGHSLGSTPRLHISVKPGSHTVKFINADQGLTKTITVSVGAGETKPAVAKLN
jgi:serine/threonine-protein kinase